MIICIDQCTIMIIIIIIIIFIDNHLDCVLGGFVADKDGDLGDPDRLGLILDFYDNQF